MTLPERQKQVLDLVQQEIKEQQRPPTLRELAKTMGISTNAVGDHLRALERKGVIVRDGKGARGIRLKPLTLVTPPSPAEDQQAEIRAIRSTVDAALDETACQLMVLRKLLRQIDSLIARTEVSPDTR